MGLSEPKEYPHYHEIPDVHDKPVPAAHARAFAALCADRKDFSALRRLGFSTLLELSILNCGEAACILPEILRALPPSLAGHRAPCLLQVTPHGLEPRSRRAQTLRLAASLHTKTRPWLVQLRHQLLEPPLKRIPLGLHDFELLLELRTPQPTGKIGKNPQG